MDFRTVGGGGGRKVASTFTDTFIRPNSAFLGPTYMTGPSLGVVGTGYGIGIAAQKAVFSASAVVPGGDFVPCNNYPLAVMPNFTTSRNQFSQIVLNALTGVVGTAILTGIGVLSGFPLLTGDYRQYVLEWGATDANPLNNQWALVRTITSTRVVLVTGAPGSAVPGQTLRLEARITAGVSVELKSFVNGVLVNTTVDNSVSRTEIGCPFFGRTVWLGTGPSNSAQYGTFTCGVL